MLSSWIAWLFFVTLLTTEFFYIQAFGGILRPYHIFLVMILAIFLPGIPHLWRSPAFRCLALVNILSILSALLSADPGAALTSYALFALNSSIAVAVAVLADLRVLTIEKMVSTLYTVSIVLAIFAIVQFAAFHGLGIVISLSDQQYSQITPGFAPSLFTEANTYAKFLLVPFFIFLPRFINYGLNRKLKILYILISVAFFINFMRSAFFGFILSILIMYIYYFSKKRLGYFNRRIITSLAAIVILSPIIIISGFEISEYNLYKFNTLFDIDAMESDGSWRHRAMAMELAIEQTLEDSYKIVFGSGWGQVYGYIGYERVQLGGADLVNFFIYDGVLGVIAYVAMIGFALRAAMRRARRAVYAYDRDLAEGVFFALVACAATAFVSGMILMPSFWLLIGMAIVFDCANAREMAARRFVPVRGRAVR